MHVQRPALSLRRIAEAVESASDVGFSRSFRARERMTCCIISWAYRGQTRRGDDVEKAGAISRMGAEAFLKKAEYALFLKKYKNIKLFNSKFKNIRVKYYYA